MKTQPMTQAVWDSMSPAERDIARDLSSLTEQLTGLEGERVEVKPMTGPKRRFYVGRSNDWRPCHVELKLSTSTSGTAAAKQYKSVVVISSKRQR